LKHRINSQITYLKLQKSFSDIAHGTWLRIQYTVWFCKA